MTEQAMAHLLLTKLLEPNSPVAENVLQLLVMLMVFEQSQKQEMELYVVRQALLVLQRIKPASLLYHICVTV